MHRNVSQRGTPKTKIPFKRGQMKYKQLTIAENFPVISPQARRAERYTPKTTAAALDG